MLQTRIKNRLIRRGIVALALLATLPGAPVAVGQTFDEAVAAYDRGDYATAVQGFLVHAEQGDAAAQFNLGVMYNNGRGVLKDEAEAVRWYRLAADAAAQFRATPLPTGWPPSRATPLPSSTSGSCMLPAWASSRIPCLRTCGPTPLAQTGTQAPGSCGTVLNVT